MALTKSLLTDVVGWDVRNWATAVRYWDETIDWSGAETLRCLELGARRGGLALWLALKGKQVVCSDVAHAAEQARPLHAHYGVEGFIEYRDIDAAAISTSPEFDDAFDVVVFKSILGGVGSEDRERQRAVIHEAFRVLRPGGMLLFAENLEGSALHRFLRSRANRWGGRWRYMTVEAFREFLSPFASVEMRTTGVIAALGRTEGQRDFLARFDHGLLNRVVPARWHYIVYGIARK